MGKGIGPFQRRLLVSLAVIEADQPDGAAIDNDLLVLWARVDGKTVAEFDYANTYRGLRALERRGYVTFTDQVDYTPKCQCSHHPDEHEEGRWRCRSRRNLGGRYYCYCKRYRPLRTPRPQWRIGLTATGKSLIGADDTARLIEVWQDIQQGRVEYAARMAEVFKKYVTPAVHAGTKNSSHISGPCATCQQVRSYLRVALEDLEDHHRWVLWGNHGQQILLAVQMALELIDK